MNFPPLRSEYTPAEIRAALYDVWNFIHKMQNQHLEAWAGKHKLPCECCQRYEAEKKGLNWAIRYFKGRPRR